MQLDRFCPDDLPNSGTQSPALLGVVEGRQWFFSTRDLWFCESSYMSPIPPSLIGRTTGNWRLLGDSLGRCVRLGLRG